MSGLDSLFGVAKFLMSSNNEKLNTINKGIAYLDRGDMEKAMEHKRKLDEYVDE